MKPAYYEAPIPQFVHENKDTILGILTRSHGFSLEHPQRNAWTSQIEILQRAFEGWESGHILFEFSIPRMGKRADVVIVISGVIVVIEFKVGAVDVDASAVEQVYDYALDLKNFHKGSHALPIVPIVVATKDKDDQNSVLKWAADYVAAPLKVSTRNLSQVIKQSAKEAGGKAIDFEDWIRSGYQPTPTIVQAAQALYQNHGVEDISRSDAGAHNLGITSNCIADIINISKERGQKSICFVTGVPGAGKTLAGLNIATKRAQEHSDEHAVFLSGNGPLVSVLREALARDESRRLGCNKRDALRRVSSFIQNIHHFRDEALKDLKAPHEHVTVFDEAQRAWTREQATRFMQTKRGLRDFDKSEPEFLLSVMDRHSDWCVVVCLIGGGQEINTGEAGLGEWLNALRINFPDWSIYSSSKHDDPAYTNLYNYQPPQDSLKVTEKAALHLSVSMRSFRAETLSSFVGHLVDGHTIEARNQLSDLALRYPLVVTRDFARVKYWLKDKARGSERFGILATSGAHRLRPDGPNVGVKIDPPVWFLNNRTDVRSSFYCEEVATEFDVQGLELDWAGVCWDADFRYRDQEWTYQNFRGTRWQNINSSERRIYLKNAYRVILTRAPRHDYLRAARIGGRSNAPAILL